MADALLTLESLRYDAGDRTLIRDVSLRIEAGRRTLILGPNGAGKSVLMRLMHGLIEPTAGRILWNGGSGTPVQAMVFQRPVMLRRSVLDNVTYALYLAGVPSAERRTRALDVLERVGLAALANRPARVLSGGEQQRVALARSMISSPKLLLLDEPLSALDVKLKKVLQAELKRLHRSLGVTFVHVTHDLEEAMMLADRICVMRAGKILQLGEPADIYYRPADPFVAGFIGETNLMPITTGARSGDHVGYTSSEIVDATGSLPSSLVAADVGQGPALMNVRPELIRRCDKDADVDCKLPATVTEVFTKGGTVQYRARSAQGQELAIEIQGTSHLPMQLGEDVWLGWAKKDIWVLKPGEA